MSTRSCRFYVAVLVVWVSVLALAGPARAYDPHWQVEEGDWYDGGNWSTGTVPNGSYHEQTFIDNGGTARIGSGSARGTILHVGLYGQGRLVQEGGSLILDGPTYALHENVAWLGRTEGSRGEHEIIGARFEAHSQYVGVEGTGILSMDSGVVELQELHVGYLESGIGQVTVGPGSSLSANEMMVIGGRGQGGFQVDNGIVSVGELILAESTSSTVEAIVSRGGVISADHAHLGARGEAGLSLIDAQASFNEMIIGSYYGSRGALSMSSGAEMYLGEWTVGRQGEAYVEMDSSSRVIATYVDIGQGAALSVEPGAVLEFYGQTDGLHIRSQDPARMEGLASLTVHVKWAHLSPTLIEAAGTDLGPVMDGWMGNFAIGQLMIGEYYDEVTGAELIDAYDNRPGAGSEAVYVQQLTFLPGGTISLGDGPNLYYLNGGAPKQLFVGDANLDGVVDVGDLGILAAHWNASTTTTTWADGDFTGDATVDVGDLGILAASWGKATQYPVPEPSSLLLMLGLAAAYRRR